MNKTLKRIIWGIVILVGILILLAGSFFLKFYMETRHMTPAETQRINDTVFCVKDRFVNTFIFKGKEHYLMVDAGFTAEGVKAELDKLGIPADGITTLLLTHTDGDHIGAVGLFKDPKIYMHKDEEQMINGTNGKFFMHPKWKFGPYILLNSNDTLTIDGLKIKIIHTPGHTPGSCCYMIGKDYLLTGDNLAYKNGEFGHFNNFFNMDTKEQEASIKTLPDLKSIPFILTAHYGIIRN